MDGLDGASITSNISVSSEDSPNIYAKLDSLCHANLPEGSLLVFHCDTIAKWPKYKHLIIVTNVNKEISIPIVIQKWFFNREISVFADTIYAFVKSLCNFAFRHYSMQTLADRYRISPKQLPESFGIRYEDWEREYKIPDLGTDDIIGSFMRLVYDGKLGISKKGLFDD